MQVQITDFNNAGQVFSTNLAAEWSEIDAALRAVTVHLKASDQAAKIGVPIWDAVGNNAAIKQEMLERGWAPNVSMPTAYRFLGTDFDFVKAGVIVEVQFSNYPFLLNNMLRCEVFYKSKIALEGNVVEAGVIVTKAKMFDASNSTLYYEQGVAQLTALAANNVFDAPLRLVGLFESYGPKIPVVWTGYSAPRYSRTVASRASKTASITAGAQPSSRAVISVNP